MIDIAKLREDKRPQSSTIVHALLDRLEAAEEDRSNFIVEMGKLCAQCDELRTKIEQSGPDGFAWPECPKRRQSHVLFDDGYEEGWAACVATIKAAWKSEGQIMCTINDEEPAFPVSTSNPYSGHQDGPNMWQFPGMTLRDYFAAKAMQGLFAAGGGVTRGAGEWASIAYKMADAMLATRKEK